MPLSGALGFTGMPSLAIPGALSQNAYQAMAQASQDHHALRQMQMQSIYGQSYQGMAYPSSIPAIEQLKEKPKMGMIRTYLDKHRDFIFTLVVIVLADHFILSGALRTRIQRLVEAVLTRLEKSLGITDKELLPQ